MPRQRDHAVHEVGFDNGLANLAFAGLVGGHAAIGKDESSDARGRKVMNEVLHPRVIGVASGRHAEFPTGVFAQAVAAPVAHVEGRVGQDVVGLEVFVQVAMEAVVGFQAEIAFDAANGEVHSRQPPSRGIAFLSENADVAFGLAAACPQ